MEADVVFSFGTCHARHVFVRGIAWQGPNVALCCENRFDKRRKHHDEPCSDNGGGRIDRWEGKTLENLLHKPSQTLVNKKIQIIISYLFSSGFKDDST